MSTGETDFKNAKTRETLKSLMEGGYKTIYVRDVAGRIETAYEAPINADIGDPCLRSKLKYEDGAGGTSRRTIAEEEDVVGWPGYEGVQVGAGNDIDNVL